MPITIPDHLPSRWMLESEGIFLLDHGSAARQDLVPLRIVLVDLAGDQAALEGLAALLGASPLHLELSIVRLGPAVAAQAGGVPLPAAQPLEAVLRRRFDGMVVAHAPYACGDWHDAPPWDEYRDLLDWSGEQVHARMFLGWSALAALAHIHGLDCRPFPAAAEGTEACRVVRRSSFLLRGFDEVFRTPAGRVAAPDADALADTPALRVLTETERLGPSLLRSHDRRDLFVLDPPDAAAASASEGAVAADVAGEWRSHATLLFLNWLNYYVYQPASQSLGAAPLASPVVR